MSVYKRSFKKGPKWCVYLTSKDGTRYRKVVGTKKEAEKAGLVNRTVPLEDLMNAAEELALSLDNLSPLAVRLTKAALYKSLDMNYFSELEDEINVQTICLNSQAAKKSLKAFIEKRRTKD